MLFRGIKYHLKHQDRNALQLMSIIVSANESLHQNVLLEYAQKIDMSDELTQARSIGYHLLLTQICRW